MKRFKTIAILLLSLSLLYGTTSCVVRVNENHRNNGNHKGWYKNSNNPHHPNSTNPGKSHSKHK